MPPIVLIAFLLMVTNAGKKHKQVIATVSITLLASLVVLTGCMPGEQQSKSTQPPPNTQDSLTNGWKIYRNEAYRFEIRHPPDWTVEQTTDYAGTQDFVFIGGPDYPELTGDAEAIIYFPESIGAAISQIGSQWSTRQVSEKEITVTGLDALVVTVTTLDQPGWKSTHVFITEGGRTYEIEIDLENPTHKAVLDSFTLLP